MPWENGKFIIPGEKGSVREFSYTKREPAPLPEKKAGIFSWFFPQKQVERNEDGRPSDIVAASKPVETPGLRKLDLSNPIYPEGEEPRDIDLNNFIDEPLPPTDFGFEDALMHPPCDAGLDLSSPVLTGELDDRPWLQEFSVNDDNATGE